MGYAKASAATIKRFTDYSGFALMTNRRIDESLTCDLRPSTFDFRLATFDLRLLTFDLRQATIDSTNVRIISVCANIFVYLRFVKNTDKKHGKNPKRYGCITITLS